MTERTNQEKSDEHVCPACNTTMQDRVRNGETVWYCPNAHRHPDAENVSLDQAVINF